MSLSVDQQAIAIKALAGAMELRFYGTAWAASAGKVELRKGGILAHVTGRGQSPDEAISHLWQQLTNVPDGYYLIVDAYGEKRRAMKWNGFMWEQVEER